MPDKEPKFKLADGPMMLSEFNPKAVDRFRDRVCEVCEQPIMTHWLVPDTDLEKRYTYWCDPERQQASTGMKI